MSWPNAKLGLVAPTERSAREFASNEVVWHLNLDQIESQTGRIIEKKRAAASEAGISTFAFDENHVLYSKLRPYLNKVVRPDEPGIATTELVPLRPKPDILNPDYLKFYLRSDRFVGFANQVVAGAKMPRMIMEKFWAHEIPLPVPREQYRIVELLEHADGLRRQRAEADKLGERILPALFYKTFGDPAANPKNWQMRAVGQMTIDGKRGVTTGPFGTQLGSEDFTSSGPEVFGIYSVDKRNIFRPGGDKHISETKFSELSRFNVRPSDVLISRMGTVGRVCVVPDGAPKGIVSYHLIRVRLNPDLCHPEYFKHFLIVSEKSGCGISRLAKGAIMSGINAAIVMEYSVAQPPIELQREFAATVSRFTTIRHSMERARRTLESLFQAMLHRAFAGELTAKWREAHLKELLAEMEQQARLLRSKSEDN